MEMVRVHKNMTILCEGISAKHEEVCQKVGYANCWNGCKSSYEKAVKVIRDLYAQRSKTTFSFGDIPTDSHWAFGPWLQKLEALKMLENDTSDEAFGLVAAQIGIDFDPIAWQQHYNDRGVENGLRPLSEHSDMSLQRYFSHDDSEVAERAKAEWRKRYDAMYWGVPPLRGDCPSGVKGWGWDAHCSAWLGHLY